MLAPLAHFDGHGPVASASALGAESSAAHSFATRAREYRHPRDLSFCVSVVASWEADRAIFIGCNLPDDDVEVVFLVKRRLAHLTLDRVTVVEHDMTLPPLAGHTVGRRDRTLFGDGVDWHPEGLDNWLLRLRA